MTMSFYTRDHSMKKDKVSNAVVLSNSNSNSSSSSSESSFWSGGLSSSDSESAHYYYGQKSRSSSSCYSMQRTKPIRTERSSSYGPSQNPKNHHHHQQEKAKMMSKALKIYNELKKVKKQPLSPGGKISSFLNSLFTHPKKTKSSGSKPSKGFDEETISKSSSSYVSTPNCSSSSSYTRSCLSKTSSSKLNNNGSTRSVKFFPVSVVVDEDSQPRGKKNILREEEEDDELKHFRAMEKNRKVAEAARKVLESYRKSKKESYVMNVDLSEDEEDDDAMSCSSSDLFELNNLSDIGIGRNAEELPVYETTHLDTNRAIANGLIV